MIRKMKLMLGLCLILVLGACAAPGVLAREDGWRTLGSRTVQGKHDHDVIAVGARDGAFRQVMVAVRGSALEMYDIRITFGDGEVYSPATRLVFGKGSESRVIDLPGEARIIRKVEFHYGNLPRGGRARVLLLGR